MLNTLKITVTAGAVLLAAGAQAAGSSALLMNDDGVQYHYIAPPNIMLLHTIFQEHTLMYSQEPSPRNVLFTTSLETENYAWKFKENQSITPRVTGLFGEFKDQAFAAIAGGAIYRYTPSESKWSYVAESYTSLRATTVIRGGFVWSARAQANFAIEKGLEINFGYRNTSVELLNKVYDGFERGLYFGLTHYHK